MSFDLRSTGPTLPAPAVPVDTSWMRDPARLRQVRVNRRYWIDAGTPGTLAHLVAGVCQVKPHEATSLCGRPVSGAGVPTVQLQRACARCIDRAPNRDVSV